MGMRQLEVGTCRYLGDGRGLFRAGSEESRTSRGASRMGFCIFSPERLGPASI